MTSLADLLARSGTPAARMPAPRHAVSAEIWTAAAAALAHGAADLMGLWSDGASVYLALHAPDSGLAVLSLALEDGRYPSIGRHHPPAQRLERALRDLHGLVPVGLEDERPWLDHGVWGVRHPLGGAEARPRAPVPYAFLRAEGEPLHQIPVGPVHAGIIEPGHFRFSANGETVVRLEERLGYVHKGIDRLMLGADMARAGRLAARLSGDATVAWSFAFSRAVEAATGTEPPPRARALRGVMAELERIANHLGDIGAVCNDAAFSIMLAHCGILRETVLRAAQACFGHRLMMDAIVPGGLARDIAGEGAARIAAALAAIDAAFPRLVTLYDTSSSLQDRTVSTGRVSADLVRRFAAGGHVGRASGRRFDTRAALPYPPYDRLPVEPVVYEEGDVDARVRVRIGEVRQAQGLIRALLADLPDGPVLAPLAGGDGEGLALVESFRGDVLVWLRLAGGSVERAHLRDPSWFQWPLLEAAIEGNIVADFPLCNKSFNCSYSGHDL